MAWQLGACASRPGRGCFPNPTGNREILQDQEGEQHGPCTGSNRSEWKWWALAVKDQGEIAGGQRRGLWCWGRKGVHGNF